MADDADLLISAAFSDAKLAAETNKVVSMFAAAGKKAQDAFNKTAADAVENSQVVKANSREIERLKRAYDPLYAASKRYEGELEKLNRAHKVGAINAKQHEAALDRLNAEFSGAEEVSTRTVGSFRAHGNALQQAGFQVGDFATQVGTGTSAAQALGQQLPQLLGAFGTFGALAGAGAAILIPLGAALIRAATDSASLEDRMDDLTKSTDAYVSAAEAAATPVDELRAKFGDLADEISRVNETTAQIAGAAAKADLGAAAKTFAGQFGGFSTEKLVTEGGFLGSGTVMKEIEETVFAVRRELGLTEQQAIDVVKALRAFQDAGVRGPDALISAGADLNDVLISIAGSADEAQKRFGEILVGENGFAGIIDEATRQVEASVSAQEKAWADLVDRYGGDTEKLKGLAGDRQTAEAALTKAVQDGNAAKIKAAEEYIRAIDREITKTKEAAAANDATMQSRIRAYQSYGESRMQGRDWANSPAGYEAQYTASRASGTGGKDEELVRSVVEVSERLGIAAKDLLAVMSFETAGTLDPWKAGPTTKWGQHRGLIQWGEPQRGQYGVSADSSISQQVEAVGRYLQDAGVKAGDSLANVYAAVLAGDARKITASDLSAGGVVGNVSEATGGGQFASHIARAEGLLAAYGGVAEGVREDIKETEKAASDALKEQVRERERQLELAKRLSEQLSANLLTEQQSLELDRQRAEQVAAINASDLSDEGKAAAIAAVNAELEKQATILKLTEEAKRRGVDLDAQMIGSAMTYRQAIEGLGEAQRQQIVNQEQVNSAQERATEQQQFMADTQDQLKNGLLEAIIAGESFADVLASLAAQFAKVALQAALFGEGPMAGAGQGGLFSGFIGSIFGGFRASGGSVSSGRAYVVGEGGPEVMVPGVSGTVLNARQVERALMNGPSAPRITINNNAPGVQVQTESVTRDEVRIMVTQGIAASNKARSDQQYLSGVR